MTHMQSQEMGKALLKLRKMGYVGVELISRLWQSGTVHGVAAGPGVWWM